jgi:iron(III) transport system permease protein
MSQETQPLVGLSLWRRGVGSWSNRPRGLLGWSAIAVALLVSIPVLSVLTNIFTPASEVWPHLIDTVLASYITNTVGLVILVAAGVVSMGVISAWLVTMCRFPGRAIFEWAMILPLAVPAYVMAYAYTDFLQFSGPVQSLLRELTGWGPRDYWFPNVRSLGGAALMLMLVTYPYVYLLARTAFLEQSVCALEVSRTLGCSPWRSFYRVAVPLARPAIVGGTILALMETLADFGTVQYFGVKTFTTGIYRAWFSMGDRIAAAQLSAALLGFVFFFLMLERLNRGRRRYHHTTSKYRQLPTYPLTGWRALLAFAGCAPPVTFGFLVPAGMLLHMALIDGDAQLGARYAGLVWNSVTLAGITAVLAVALAVLMNYGARLHPGAFVHLAGRIASLGYAVPGSVIAVGVLLPC